MAGIKRTKHDAVFSNLIRERAEWKCERCGTQYQPPTMGLHCAHLFTRRGRSTRWAPDGAIAACYGCHQYIDSHPAEKEMLARRILGDGRYDLLTERAHKPVKLTKADLEDIYQHLKAEYSRMKEARGNGVVGRIEFEDPM